jgi:hypothetical protein
MTPATKRTTTEGGLTRSAKHLTSTSPQTSRAIERYYEREEQRGRKIVRTSSTPRRTGTAA